MRLFVSVPLPDEQRRHLQAALAGGRTSDPARWHLTLAFLGDRDDDLELLDALAGISHAPFDLHLASGGSFPGVEWAGVDGDVRALSDLAGEVAAACRVQQAHYRPHLTVARRGRAKVPSDYVGPPWTVDRFDLVHSVLGQAAEHRVLATFPLDPADGAK